MTQPAVARRSVPTTPVTRIGHRRKVSVPGRLTWRDTAGSLRFASVMTRDASDVDLYVECQVATSIPLYRLVHFQVERPTQDADVPASLQGKILCAIYRVGAYKSSTGTPHGYALRILSEPRHRGMPARAARFAAN